MIYDSIIKLLSNREMEVDYPIELYDFAYKLKQSKKNSSKTLELSASYEETGAKGHYVVCKILNIPFNYDIYIGGDGGTDIKIDDHKIQIKSTSYFFDKLGESPHLIFFMDDKLKCDYYFLVHILNNKYKFLGWISRDEIIEKRIIYNHFKPDYNGRKERYLIHLKDLNDSYWRNVLNCH